MRMRNTMAVVAILLAIAMGAATEARGLQDSKAAAATMSVNLNTATQVDLEKLPGIGPAMAKAILDYRQKTAASRKSRT